MIRRLKVKRGWDAASEQATDLFLGDHICAVTIGPKHTLTVRARDRFSTVAKYKWRQIVRRHR